MGVRPPRLDVADQRDGDLAIGTDGLNEREILLAPRLDEEDVFGAYQILVRVDRLTHAHGRGNPRRRREPGAIRIRRFRRRRLLCLGGACAGSRDCHQASG